MLYYATTEIWVVSESGHRVPLLLPGYGNSQQAAKDDAAFRAERWAQANTGEREKLRFVPYRLIDTATG